MRIKKLPSRSRILELLNYEPLTGEFRWIARSGPRCTVGAVAGCAHHTGYIYIAIDGETYCAHRLAWVVIYDVEPLKFLDHVDGLRDNNAIANLREADDQLNAENRRRKHKNNSTGFLGVRKQKRWSKFEARIRVRGELLHLGHFKTPEAAHAAYLEAKRTLHKGNTL